MSTFVPAVCGYVMTIRRTQGCTLAMAGLYFDRRVAGRGYGYVGASHVRHKNDLYLMERVRRTDWLPIGEDLAGAEKLVPSILSEDDASDERSDTDSDSRDDNSDSGGDTDSRDDEPDSDDGQEMQRIAHANVGDCISEDLEPGLNGEHFELANFIDDAGLEAAGLLGSDEEKTRQARRRDEGGETPPRKGGGRVASCCSISSHVSRANWGWCALWLNDHEARVTPIVRSATLDQFANIFCEFCVHERGRQSNRHMGGGI